MKSTRELPMAGETVKHYDGSREFYKHSNGKIQRSTMYASWSQIPGLSHL